jgi:hypothetical protein
MKLEFPFKQPRTEFVLRRMLREDQAGLDGRTLTPELRSHFGELLRQHADSQEIGRCR